MFIATLKVLLQIIYELKRYNWVNDTLGTRQNAVACDENYNSVSVFCSLSIQSLLGYALRQCRLGKWCKRFAGISESRPTAKGEGGRKLQRSFDKILRKCLASDEFLESFKTGKYLLEFFLQSIFYKFQFKVYNIGVLMASHLSEYHYRIEFHEKNSWTSKSFCELFWQDVEVLHRMWNSWKLEAFVWILYRDNILCHEISSEFINDICLWQNLFESLLVKVMWIKCY